VDTRITYEPEIPGFVAEYEEREAARTTAIAWDRYEQLERQERVAIVAWARTKRLAAAHEEDAIARYHEREEFARRLRGGPR
jgi:hypothetical protein